MKTKYIYLILTILFFRFITYSQTINLNKHTNELVELTFTSSITYNNPLTDITIECSVFNQSDTIHVLGFWNGDNVYKIRFSLPTTGEWNFKTYCSDNTNTQLHNQIGKITISNYTGNNALYKKGPIKVSPNKNYLVYNNGDPFFYLGDTAWEITWKSYKEQVYEYISDRKNKGFTTIQVVALSHQVLLPNGGIMNRYHETAFLNNNYSDINPKYFDYLDFIVNTANDSDLIVALVPLWAYFSEIPHYYPPDPNYNYHLTIPQSFNLAKYLGARYSGFQTMWIIAGDNVYETDTIKQFWSEFANIIKKSNGNTQLNTCHTGAWFIDRVVGSFDFFDDEKYSWLDFHMYQSSHTAGTDGTWEVAERGMNLNIPKPILNGEPCYEDIYNNLWLPGDTSHVKSFRISPINVRQASYESILNGARVGITYGGNGVWQWSTNEMPGPHLSRLKVLDAIKMPASNHMTILKNIMEKYKWYSFVPKQEYISSFESEENFIPISENDDIGIIYIPKNTSYISLNANSFNQRYSYYINPSTGDSIPNGYISSSQLIVSPQHTTDTLDWILIIDKNDHDNKGYIPDNNMKTLNENIKLSNPYPNPFNMQTTIMFYINDPCFISIKIYNTLGQEVFNSDNKYYNTGYQYFTWVAKSNSSGAYFYKIESDNHSKIGKIVLVK